MRGIVNYIFVPFVFVSLASLAQTIKSPASPTFNEGFHQQGSSFPSGNHSSSSYHNSSVVENNKTFSPSFKAPSVNVAQNNQTVKILDVFKEANSIDNSQTRKHLWELKLRSFKFINPNTELYKKLQPFYEAAFDSINQMLSGSRPLDLKKAVFLVENAYYQNKMKYADFCKLIDNKVYVLNQIIEKEKLSRTNNVALNYAIQQLYLKPVKYTDKNGAAKVHNQFKYDFEDYMGASDYTKQFVTKFLYSGKGQCHSMPLLYLILANEIGAKANLAYSPSHSYIVFPDEENNFYNFECTSACFPSYSYIMSSGHVSKEAIESGIYTLPVSLKETIANQLNELATQQMFQFKGIDDFQLKCAKRTLEVFPNDIMALMTISNHQTAKTDAAIYYSGCQSPKDIPNYPGVKEEFDKRNNLYDYMDNLGYTQIPENEYNAWLNAVKLEKAKQESEEIKKIILMKAKSIN